MKSFLITSHTQGSFPIEQTALLKGLIENLRHFNPKSFIVVASQSSIGSEIEQLADYVVIDRTTVNEPYGAGELALVRAGLEVMEKFNRPNCYKITYDFVIDHTNYWVLDHWSQYNRDFVSCYWRTVGVGVGSWAWWGTVEIQKKIFNSIVLDNYLEHKIRDVIHSQGLLDRCYFYEDKEDMFYGDHDAWFSRCDLVHAGGTVLKHNYGTTVAVARLNDDNADYFGTQLWMILNQTKKIDHLLLVDGRKQPTDIRADSRYQMFIKTAAEKNIIWTLIFDPGDDRMLLEYIGNLNHKWCWLVSVNSIPDIKALEKFYQKMIVNFYDTGSVRDGDKNLFFRNHKVDIEYPINNLVDSVVDILEDINYNNYMLF